MSITELEKELLVHLSWAYGNWLKIKAEDFNVGCISDLYEGLIRLGKLGYVENKVQPHMEAIYHSRITSDGFSFGIRNNYSAKRNGF